MRTETSFTFWRGIHLGSAFLMNKPPRSSAWVLGDPALSKRNKSPFSARISPKWSFVHNSRGNFALTNVGRFLTNFLDLYLTHCNASSFWLSCSLVPAFFLCHLIRGNGFLKQLLVLKRGIKVVLWVRRRKRLIDLEAEYLHDYSGRHYVAIFQQVSTRMSAQTLEWIHTALQSRWSGIRITREWRFKSLGCFSLSMVGLSYSFAL